MKLKRINDKNCSTVADLVPPGNCFYRNGDLFIKTFCRQGDCFNAVRLSDGMPFLFTKATAVVLENTAYVVIGEAATK